MSSYSTSSSETYHTLSSTKTYQSDSSSNRSPTNTNSPPKKHKSCFAWCKRITKVIINTTKHLALDFTRARNRPLKAIKIIILTTFSILLLPFTLLFIIQKSIQDLVLFPMQKRFIAENPTVEDIKSLIDNNTKTLEQQKARIEKRIKKLEMNLISFEKCTTWIESNTADQKQKQQLHKENQKSIEKIKLKIAHLHQASESLKDAISYQLQTSRLLSELRLESISHTLNEQNYLAYLNRTQASKPDGVCIIFQPNGLTAQAGAAFSARAMAHGNYHCLFVEYPGYGDAEGEIYSEQDVFATAEAAYQMAKTHFPDLKVITMGTSIGTGSAAYLAGKYPTDIQRVILNAPYKSITDLIGFHVNPLLAKLFSCYDVDSESYLTRYIDQNPSAELVLIHPESDAIIPIQHSRDIYSACEKAKTDNPHKQKIKLYSLPKEFKHCDMPDWITDKLLTEEITEVAPADFKAPAAG